MSAKSIKKAEFSSAFYESKPDFNSAVKNASFGVPVDFGEGRRVVRWENYLGVTALAHVG